MAVHTSAQIADITSNEKNVDRIVVDLTIPTIGNQKILYDILSNLEKAKDILHKANGFFRNKNDFKEAQVSTMLEFGLYEKYVFLIHADELAIHLRNVSEKHKQKGEKGMLFVIKNNEQSSHMYGGLMNSLPGTPVNTENHSNPGIKPPWEKPMSGARSAGFNSTYEPFPKFDQKEKTVEDLRGQPALAQFYLIILSDLFKTMMSLPSHYKQTVSPIPLNGSFTESHQKQQLVHAKNVLLTGIFSNKHFVMADDQCGIWAVASNILTREGHQVLTFGFGT